MRKEKVTKHFLECMIAMVLSVAAFAFIPAIVDAGLGKGSEGLMSALLGLLVCGCIVIALTGLMRHRESKKRGESYLASLGRVLLLAPVYLAVSLAGSILSGVMAVLVYNALAKTLSLDQIKGIIDLLATVLTILTVPVLVSLFWEQIGSSETFGTAVKHGLRRVGKNYLNILISMLVCVGAGWLILTVFHYLPGNGVTTAAKILIFGAIGTAALVSSQNACRKGAYLR